MSHLSLPDSVNTVSVEDAVRNACNWREYLGSLEPGVPEDSLMRGFFIPIHDIVRLAGFEPENARGVRAYLCLRKPGDISTLHLLLVPMGKEGADRLRWKKGDGTDEDSSIYNLTQPCPTYCDKSSEMYGPQP